jgi:hypothetical protein
VANPASDAEVARDQVILGATLRERADLTQEQLVLTPDRLLTAGVCATSEKVERTVRCANPLVVRAEPLNLV